MPDLPPADEEFVRRALDRWLLTPAEADLVRHLCGETGVSAADAVRERRLLDPGDVAALLEWIGPAPLSAAALAQAPAINRRYQILGLLAEGGMGRVYLVADPVRGETLALKTLRKERSIRRSTERFAAEFRILAGLRHPNVQTVFDYGTVEDGPAAERGSLFFTCERIEGADLMRATEGKPWRDALPLLVQLCRGLQFLHARGLMHLDVKPENVLVCAGPGEPAVKLVDFGLAQPVEAGDGLEIAGTLAYLSPEMIRGEPVDHRADLYALGATLYEVLARRPPYSAPSPRALIQAHLESEVPWLRASIPEIPEALEELVRGLLAKAVPARPASAEEAIRRLSQVAGIAFEAETKGTLKGYVSSGAFVGRADELAWLRGGWERIARAEPGPRFLLVAGESGIGKSRLVREFRIWAQTHGVVVIEGTAQEGARRPFGLFREPLDRLVRQVEVWERVGLVPAGTVDAYAPHLRDVAPGLEARHPVAALEELDAEKAWLRLLDKTSEFILRSVQGTGLLLVLEDLQWADEASVDLAEFLARKAATGSGQAKLLVIATLRHGDVPAEVGRVVDRLTRAGLAQERRLRALPRGEMTELVRTMFGDGSEAILDRVLDAEEGGNPHFLEEVLREWVDAEALRRRSWGWEVDRERVAALAVPRGVRDLLARRLARTGLREQRWLGRLAVWGAEAREPDLWVLGLLASATVADLVRRGLLRDESGAEGLCLRFAHAHAAAAAREAMPEEDRRSTSAEFLRALEAAIAAGRRSEAEELDRMARLAWEAGDNEAFRRWGTAAAREAERRHALGEARDHWRRLLEIETAPEQRTTVREKLGDLHAALGDLGAADAGYREAISETAHREFVAREASPSPGLPIALTRLLRKLAQVAHAAGRIEDAATWYAQALREARAAREPGEPAGPRGISRRGGSEAPRGSSGKTGTHDIEAPRGGSGSTGGAADRRAGAAEPTGASGAAGEGAGGAGPGDPSDAGARRAAAVRRAKGKETERIQPASLERGAAGDGVGAAPEVGRTAARGEATGGKRTESAGPARGGRADGPGPLAPEIAAIPADPELELAREEARVLAICARFETEARGDAAVGERLALEARAVAERCGDAGREELHLALLSLGVVCRARGDLEAARGHFAAVEEFRRAQGHGVEAAAAAAHLGEAELARGSIDEALAAFRRCLDAAESGGDRRTAARAWGLIARARRAQADVGGALDALDRERAVAGEIGWAAGIAEGHAEAARVYLQLAPGSADPSIPRERGLRHFRLAIDVLESAGARREAGLLRGEWERITSPGPP